MRWLQRSGQVWCERVSEVENPPWTQHHTVHERRTEQKAAQPGLHTHINTHTVHKPTWTTTEPVNSWVRLQPVKPHWPQDIQQERGKTTMSPGRVTVSWQPRHSLGLSFFMIAQYYVSTLWQGINEKVGESWAHVFIFICLWLTWLQCIKVYRSYRCAGLLQVCWQWLC